MNLEDLTPVGGSLRAPAAPSISKLAGTFTPTVSPHPDEIWNPRGSELSPRLPPLSRGQFPAAHAHAGAERAVGSVHAADPDDLSFEDVAARTRAALRSGT